MSASILKAYRGWMALVAVVVVGCGGHAMGVVNFSGLPQPPVVPPEHVQDVLQMPPGYESIGELSVDCSDLRGSCLAVTDTLDECDLDRMIGALKEEASRVGGEFIVQRRCDTDNHESTGCGKTPEHSEVIRCRALVARRVAPGTAGSTGGVPNSQLPPALRATAN